MDILNILGQALLQGGQVPNVADADIDNAPEIVSTAAPAPLPLQRDITLQREGTDREYAPGTGGPAPKGRKILADILGTLGDALLVGNKRDAVYAPYKQQQKLSEAMEIYRTDPVAGRRYVEQANPEFAREMFSDEAKQALEAQKLSRQTQADQRLVQQNRLNAFGTIGQYANAIKDDASYQRMKPVLEGYLKDQNIPYTLPDRYDANIVQDLIRAALGSYKEERLDQMGANTASTIEDRKVRQGQGAERLRIQQNRAGVQEAEAESRNTKRQWDMDNPPATRGGRKTGVTSDSAPVGTRRKRDGAIKQADGTWKK